MGSFLVVLLLFVIICKEWVVLVERKGGVVKGVFLFCGCFCILRLCEFLIYLCYRFSFNDV